MKTIGQIDLPRVLNLPLVEQESRTLWSCTYAGIRVYGPGPAEALEKMRQTIKELARFEARDRLRRHKETAFGRIQSERDWWEAKHAELKRRAAG